MTDESMKMKLFKLVVHQKTFCEDSLLINPKDFPTLLLGSIVEIYLPEDTYSRLLLQVTTLREDFHQKDTISIEQSISNSFKLRVYGEVVVNVVNPKDVALDSLELTFKDQYLARSDMWRLKKCMVNSCVYLNKKVEFYGIRCQVYEMWAQGERVACGVITDETKIVYRSASSMVYLFFQMSSEMWDFDINGDLYFEKAINGFLSDLFAKWKNLNCNHDVTIVLFSRTFYEAQSIEEFPTYMHECLQKDHKGRFYEDFYRVAVQNERYDDWNSVLILLKKLFNQYQHVVLEYHKQPGIKIPLAVNSTSSQGNFLEVLNMAINVFEKHYLDRSFDRTGQLSVVVSPGVGVFEVDRELTNITKQRVIDNGIASDLVCLGEQPLHAVPLFKFHNKFKANPPSSEVDDYNMPHWINLSFYSSTKQISYSNFVPRIKLPTPMPKNSKDDAKGFYATRSRHASQPEPTFPVPFDYDEYDSQIFKYTSNIQTTRMTRSLQRPGRRRETVSQSSIPTKSPYQHRKISEDVATTFTLSEPSPCSISLVPTPSAAIAIPHHNSQNGNSSSIGTQGSTDGERSYQRPASKDDLDPEFSPPYRTIVGSAGSPGEVAIGRPLAIRRPKALVNPFDPSHVTIKLTSNRRRWTHVFPLGVLLMEFGSTFKYLRGPTGIFMQQHHYQAIPQYTAVTLMPSSADSDSIHSEDAGRLLYSGYRSLSFSESLTDRSTTWLWGATGEQEWTPAITTGVDWKSLVIPALLPITTDYFPDKSSLQNDYVISDYFLQPEDIIAENAPRKYFRSEDGSSPHRCLTTPEVYNELICQRLQQGFQIIVVLKQHAANMITPGSSSPHFTPPLHRFLKNDNANDYLLSIGRIFHKFTLNGSTITVTQFRPRHPYPEIKIHYCYRFRAPDNDTYGVSWVDFANEKLENYNWNYLEYFVCMKGEGDFELKESLKFWRLRMLVLPGVQSATRQIIEGNSELCDLYGEFSLEQSLKQRENFIKFLEFLNRIIRPTNAQKSKPTAVRSPPRRLSLGQAAVSQNTSVATFRERVSSNRIHDRPRSRSSSGKGLERIRAELGSTGRVSPSLEAESKLNDSNTSLESPVEGETSDDFVQDIKHLSEFSSHAEIAEQMKHPVYGLNFLGKQPGLPSWSFISEEAMTWVREHIDGICLDYQVIYLLQSMINEKLICHASGVQKHKFIPGFYIYYLVSPDNTNKENESHWGDIELFQREWLEVELPVVKDIPPVSVPFSFAGQKDSWPPANFGRESYEESELTFKCGNVDIDAGGKSDRLEWGQARYHSLFIPYEAFEIVMEWMVATGNIVGDLVMGWARKAALFGLQLVPIPSDPFALPFSSKSDPLRGPIFVSLDLECLPDSALQTMEEEAIISFQKSILQRFGFLPYRDPKNPKGSPQYVHISGSMFIMIPYNVKENQCSDNSKGKEPHIDLQQLCSPHDEYITRHFSGLKKSELCALSPGFEAKLGFLWSWNYMITKRWKSQATGDENFMRKVMHDFCDFCANKNGRLQEFWNDHLLPNFQSSDEGLFAVE